MDERLRFVARLFEGEKMAPLCAEFGISRKTGYKIFDGYKECGLSAQTDRSRRPHRQANRLPAPIEATIVRLKREYPGWGAPKIREKLRRQFTGPHLPAISTVHAVLDRQGLVHRRRRRRHTATGTQLSSPTDANALLLSTMLMTTPTRWLPLAPIILGLVSISGCARRAQTPTDQDGRNATIAFYHLQARYDAIADTGRRLADHRVPLSGIPFLIKDLCTNRCEADYLRCVVTQSKVALPADFDAPRAPKEFPFEIPECTRDPDCGGARIVSQPSHASCEQTQAICLKTCEVP